MAAIDAYTAVRYWIRALRIRQLFVSVAWLVPTWWALASWEWSRSAIELIDSTSLRGLSLAGVACAVYSLSALFFKLVAKLQAKVRLTRIQATRASRAVADRLDLEARYRTCDDDERLVLKAAVDSGLQSLGPKDFLAAYPNFSPNRLKALDAAIRRLGAREYLTRYIDYETDKTVIAERVFREITSEPVLVGSEKPAKSFGVGSR